MLLLGLLLALVCVSWADDVFVEESLPRQSLRMDPNTVLVIFGMRHGNRHPERFIEEKSRRWGEEGATELTKFGKIQSYGFGRELRRFTGTLLSRNYLRDEAKFFTSSASRCQMSMQATTAGLYPPDTFARWNPSLDWSPIPYVIDDPMLRMYAVDRCPKSETTWSAIANDTLPEQVELISKKREILEYIANNTGWEVSLSSGADLADNIMELDLYGTRYPVWMEKPLLEDYDKEKLKNEILSLGENHQILCTQMESCRDLMGGVWLHHLVKVFEKALRGDKLSKIIGFASHTEITLSVMKMLLLEKSRLTTSAGFIIEYRELPNSSIRILLHDPNPVERHVIYQAIYQQALKDIATEDNWIPVEKFLELIKGKAIVDWRKACGTSSDCPLNTREDELKENFKEEQIKEGKQGDPAAFIKKEVISGTVPGKEKSDIFADECAHFSDTLGEKCIKLAKFGFCNTHEATKYLWCRKSCLCGEQFKEKKKSA